MNLISVGENLIFNVFYLNIFFYCVFCRYNLQDSELLSIPKQRELLLQFYFRLRRRLRPAEQYSDIYTTNIRITCGLPRIEFKTVPRDERGDAPFPRAAYEHISRDPT